MITDKQKKEFLINLVKEVYTQGDNFSASQSSKGSWHFGYSNDYPMQHGNGKRMMLTDEIVEMLILKTQLTTDKKIEI
jgi:hypothetical protein